jgi:hypothetical protein
MKQSTASIARVAAFGLLSETISTARLNAGNPPMQSLLRFVVLIVVLQGSEIEAGSRIRQGSFAIQSAKSNSKRLDIGTIKARASRIEACRLAENQRSLNQNGPSKDG